MQKQCLVVGLLISCLIGAISWTQAQPPDPLPQAQPPNTLINPPLHWNIERPLPDLSTPLMAIYSFSSGIQSGEAGQALDCLDNVEHNSLQSAYLADYAALVSSAKFVVTDVKIEEDGDHATAKFVVGFINASPLFFIAHPEQLYLRRVGKTWKIQPGDPQALRLPAMIAGDAPLLQTIATALAHPQIVFGEVQRHLCAGNLKQLALGALMIAQDYDNKFDFKTSLPRDPDEEKWGGWPEVARCLWPYVKDREAFHCPTTAKNSFSYTLNPQLQDFPSEKIKDPAKVVLFYEGKDGQLDFRHERHTTVAFADGHIELLSKDEAKELRWNPTE